MTQTQEERVIGLLRDMYYGMQTRSLKIGTRFAVDSFQCTESALGKVTFKWEHPDGENAKFIYDGFAEVMLVRNSGQIAHFPIVDQAVRDMLEEIKILLVTEMDGDDIDDVYEAPVEILNSDLPIPQAVRNGLFKDHKIKE